MVEVFPSCSSLLIYLPKFYYDRTLGYVVDFRRNVNELKGRIEQLTTTRNDVQRLVDAALGNNQIIRPKVLAWLARADAVQAEATELNDKATQINCWIKGWCTCSRFILSRESQEMVGVIERLLYERSGIFGKYGYFEQYGVYIDFPSRKPTVEQAMMALKNDDIRLVGFFGMAGVGKTMFVQALSEQAKEEQLFDEVVLVSLSSQELDLRMIQDNIAKELDLVLEENEGDISRAERISQRLLQHTNVLVVLDNLWERVELAKVGIHLQNNKVIFTTRDQAVCDKMETDEKIEVVVLSDEDSWSLFRQNAGHKSDSPDLQTIATNILYECKGLPLAIVTLGVALKYSDEKNWENTLVQLRKLILDGMSPLISSIRLSFNLLPNENYKVSFLFCCLFRKNFKVDVELLLWYVMGEELFKWEARSMLDDIVGMLVSSPLLLYDKEDHTHIWMNDVVHDVAISIASEKRYGFVMKDGVTLKENADIELHECKRLLLMSTKIRFDLPNQINAPELLTLSLNGYSDLNEIPPDFFMEMKNLKVLDISNTDIESLPQSLTRLVNLRSLLMKNCRKLKDVSLIEKLEKLVILDLSGSNMQRLPKIRMTNLKWFHY